MVIAQVEADASNRILIESLSRLSTGQTPREALETVATVVRKDPDLPLDQRAALYQMLGLAFEKEGSTTRSAASLATAVRLRRIHYGLAHRLTLQSQLALGRVLLTAGQVKKARKLHETSLNLALSRHSVGDPLCQQARQALEEALASTQKEQPPMEREPTRVMDLQRGTFGPLRLGMSFEETLTSLHTMDLRRVRMAPAVTHLYTGNFRLYFTDLPGSYVGFRADGVLLEMHLEENVSGKIAVAQKQGKAKATLDDISRIMGDFRKTSLSSNDLLEIHERVRTDLKTRLSIPAGSRGPVEKYSLLLSTWALPAASTALPEDQRRAMLATLHFKED